MAITSIGYDGTIDEVSWAKLQKASASVYGVSTANSWKVTAVAGADRTISIAPGSGWGHHVFDESDTNYTLQGGTVSSGSRWDMVVLRRDWVAVGGGPSAFRLNPGNANRALASRTSNPGVRDDQPIALVQFSAGKTQPNAIIDLRAFASNGGVEVADRLALDYLASPGAAVKLGNTLWRYELQANGVWSWSAGPTRLGLLPSGGWNIVGTTVTETEPGAQHVKLSVMMKRTGGSMRVTNSAGLTRLTSAIVPSECRPSSGPVDVVTGLTSEARTWGGLLRVRVETDGSVSIQPITPLEQTLNTGAYFQFTAEWVRLS